LGNLQNTAATGIRDVTRGNNDYNGVIGFDAVPGFDLASGWGTPDITKFVSAFIDTALVNAKLVITPSTLSFGKLTLKNSTSLPRPVTIKNASSGTSRVLVSITGQSTSSPFAVSHKCDKTLLPGKSCTVKVTFHPTDTILYSGQLVITDNETSGSQTVVLMGTGKPR
jgi:hypothetical protein